MQQLSDRTNSCFIRKHLQLKLSKKTAEKNSTRTLIQLGSRFVIRERVLHAFLFCGRYFLFNVCTRIYNWSRKACAAFYNQSQKMCCSLNQSVVRRNVIVNWRPCLFPRLATDERFCLQLCWAHFVGFQMLFCCCYYYFHVVLLSF